MMGVMVMRLLLDGKQMLDFSVCHKSRHRYLGSNWVVTVAVAHFAANAHSCVIWPVFWGVWVPPM